jgi:mercuric ion transport protein
MTADSDARSSRHVWSATAAVAGAVGVSLCCIGPFVLFALGLTSIHVVEALEPYKPFVVGGELVAFALYRRYRPEPTCEVDDAPGRTKQLVFWIALVLIVGSLVALAW